jgi:hypothetical protein
LDFRGLSVRFLLRILWLNFPSNDKFSHIVLLCQIEKLANFARPFGTKTFGVRDIRESGNLSIALLDDNEGEDGEIGTHDAATDRLAFAFSGTAGTVTGVAFGEEETDTSGM